MDRVDKILNHDLFITHMKLNEAAEADRRFCRHDIGHFLDVARIAMNMNLQDGLGIEKDIIYAAALLHDIGRHIQYENGTPHEEASAVIAPQILVECGFDEKETDVILSAIRTHRTKEIGDEASLSGILYRADKASRACFACKAEPDCNWKQDKKNLQIKW